jgi:hypothetical protein
MLGFTEHYSAGGSFGQSMLRCIAKKGRDAGDGWIVEKWVTACGYNVPIHN